MRKISLCLIWILILFRSSFSQSDYLIPLDEDYELSSIFADHRNFHFHSGVDFKTGERIGEKVYASRSGSVYRLFASWWGYGKAVYLRHPDGKLTVYAHLSDFSEKLRKIVTEEQLKNRRYRVDIFLEDTIKVEQGELIGYSGETGTGDPHLHFEIRDEKNKPINPLTSAFSIQDSIPPVLEKIGIKPLDSDSYVDGSNDIKFYPLYFDSTEKVYTLKEIPIVKGRIGIELSVYDQMREKGSKFGILKLELFLDTLLVFSSRYDTIDFENSWKVELDRDFELLQKKEGEFYKLYLDCGNDLPLYYSLNRGNLELKGNTNYLLRMQAQDASENNCIAKISVRAVDDYANLPTDTEYQDICIFRNGDRIIKTSEDGQAWVEIDSGSVFKRIELKVEKLEMPDKLRPKAKSFLYSFSPSGLPLAKPAKVSISYKGEKITPSKTGLYEWNDSAYKFIGQESDTIYNSLSGKVRNLSTYILLEDKEAPEIKNLNPQPGKKIKDKEIIISALVRDELSGFGSDLDIEIILDRNWLIPEYDPEKFLLTSKPLEALTLGWHNLLIKVRDRMGNKRIVKSRFKVI